MKTKTKKRKYHFEPVLKISVEAKEFIDGEFHRRVNWLDNVDLWDIMGYKHYEGLPHVPSSLQNHRTSIFLYKLKQYIETHFDFDEKNECDWTDWDDEIISGWSSEVRLPEELAKLKLKK